MTGFLRALSAEFLKLRRSLMLWLALAAPFVVVMLAFLVANADFKRRIGSLAGINPWDRMRSAFLLWSILMMPLFLTLEAALSASLEHASKQWKHLFALPISRWSIYAAKTAVLLALGALAVLTLWLGILSGGFLLRALHPGLSPGPTGAVEILRLATLAYLAATFMVAIQLWISLWSPSFSLSVGFGMLATTIALPLAGTNWSRGYPWVLASEVVAQRPEHHMEAVIVGIAGAIIVTIVGCWTVTRRDVV